MSENAVTTTAKKAGQKVKVTFKTITDPARRRVGGPRRHYRRYLLGHYQVRLGSALPAAHPRA